MIHGYTSASRQALSRMAAWISYFRRRSARIIKMPATTAHTETNTQVKEVDEPDFVKNDGKRIFALSGGYLYAATSWPPEELTTVGKVMITRSERVKKPVIFSTTMMATEPTPSPAVRPRSYAR